MRLIDADELMKTLGITDMDCDKCEWEDGHGFCTRGGDFTDACTAIEDAPIVEERKKGKWIDMADFEQCSCCQGTHLKEFQSYYGKTTWIKTPFCPNCGADMRGEQ